MRFNVNFQRKTTEMRGKIPTTVITGFLGSGKTTLVQHLLGNAGNRRIALIINEFGDLGVDGEILKGCGLESCNEDGIIELSNGCICCTVVEEFEPAMLRLTELDPPPDQILVETSGLALPQPLVRAFNWPDLRTRVTVDGVVAVIDGPAVLAGQFAHDVDAVNSQRLQDESLDHESALSELYEDQLACADIVVVNKKDLMHDFDLKKVKERIRASVRNETSVLSAAMGTVDVRAILGLDAEAENDMDLRTEIHHRHDEMDTGDSTDSNDTHGHDEFESFVVELPEFLNPEGLENSVRRAFGCDGLLRMKGFAAIRGKPMRLVVQAVGPRISHHYDRPFRKAEPRISRLVAIGMAGMDRAAIERAFADTVA